MTNVQVERGYLTQSLGSASHSGEHGLKTVPGLLKLVREKQAWMERIIVQTGEEFEGFSSFEEYVKANPPKGLGTDLATLKKLIIDDKELRDWIDSEIEKTHPQGGNRRSASFKGVNHSLEVGSEKKRDRSDQLIRRLRHDFPELHIRVLSGEITITKAAEEAKIYPHRIAVNLRDAKSAAATLTSHAPPEYIEELKRLL